MSAFFARIIATMRSHSAKPLTIASAIITYAEDSDVYTGVGMLEISISTPLITTHMLFFARFARCVGELSFFFDAVEDIEQEPFATLVVSKLRGSLKLAVVKAPGYECFKAVEAESLRQITSVDFGFVAAAGNSEAVGNS
nr:ruBisCO large subunit-binding protein subunit beta, chloroplastic-like [Ipomoea batatas]